MMAATEDGYRVFISLPADATLDTGLCKLSFCERIVGSLMVRIAYSPIRRAGLIVKNGAGITRVYQLKTDNDR